MSSRPLRTSHPAFAMVLGSSTFFLFGCMARTLETAPPGRGRAKGGKPMIHRERMGGQAQHAIDPKRRPWPMWRPEKTKDREKRLAREQAQNALEERRRRSERLARHPELGIRREHGALRLGFGRRRHAARTGGLHGRRPDAAGDLADRSDSHGA